MMKKSLTLLLLLVGFGTALRAQRYCDIETILVSPTDGGTVSCTDSTYVSYLFVNNGPDALVPGDTVLYYSPISLDYYYYFAVSDTIYAGDTAVYYGYNVDASEIEWLLSSDATAQVENADFTDGESYYWWLEFGMFYSGGAEATDVVDTSDDNNYGYASVTYSCATSGILGSGKAAASTISVYPNPASTNLNFNVVAKSNSDVSVKVTDVLGRVVFAANYSNLSVGDNKIEIDLSKFVNGNYILVVNDDQVTSTAKFTVSK
ncbi:MAG: T9SS type A sorting domain-containing protein [Edaphocola sp.]